MKLNEIDDSSRLLQQSRNTRTKKSIDVGSSEGGQVSAAHDANLQPFIKALKVILANQQTKAGFIKLYKKANEMNKQTANKDNANETL